MLFVQKHIWPLAQSPLANGSISAAATACGIPTTRPTPRKTPVTLRTIPADVTPRIQVPPNLRTPDASSLNKWREELICHRSPTDHPAYSPCVRCRLSETSIASVVETMVWVSSRPVPRDSASVEECHRVRGGDHVRIVACHDDSSPPIRCTAKRVNNHSRGYAIQARCRLIERDRCGSA